MRTRAISDDDMEHVLRLLTYPNEIVCRVCLAHGLRVGDVLCLKTRQIRQSKITLREQKTGKRRVIQLSDKLRRQILAQSGDVYAFPGRCDGLKHRTRQAVYKDLKRAAHALRMGAGVGTHSMRKSAAVRKYKACGDMRQVQRLLNHSDEIVTALYALAFTVASHRQARSNAEGAERACERSFK